MFLAENVWQSMDSSLSCIGLALVGFGVLVLVGFALIESKLSRLNKTATALLEEMKKANDWLEKIAARTGRIAPPQASAKVQIPSSKFQESSKLQKEENNPSSEADVYKID